MIQEVTKVFSGGLVALLAFIAVWGQCFACPLIVPQKTCCSHESGNCQMPSPKPQPSERPCPDQTFAPAAHHDTQVSLAAIAAPAPAVVEMPAPVAAPAAEPRAELNTGPPDLYLLNAVLLV